MKSVRLLTIAASALLLSACSAPVVGTVVNKDYDEGRWETYSRSERYACGTENYTTTSTINGKTTTRTNSRTKYCTRTVPDRRWHNEDWDVTVRDDEGREHEVEVSKAEYDTYQIGSHFDNTKK